MLREKGARSEPASTPPTEKGSMQKQEGDYKVISIRLRAAEFDDFFAQAKDLGLSSNLALRIAARRIGGFLEIDGDTREKLEGVLSSIGDISRQIASSHSDYLASGMVDPLRLAAQRSAFGQEFTQLDALLRSILNISRRRCDGRQRLADAMTSEALDIGGHVNG